METKFIEIRDRGTTISALATRISGDDSWLARRVGFARRSPAVILTNLADGRTQIDAHEWPNQRTWGHAHRQIEANWDAIPNEGVVDVEFILGETDAPKSSERIYYDRAEALLG